MSAVGDMDARPIIRFEDVPDELPEVRAAVEAAVAGLKREPQASCPHLFDHRGLAVLCLADRDAGFMCPGCANEHENAHVPSCTVCTAEVVGAVHAFGVGVLVMDAHVFDLMEGERTLDRHVVFSVMVCGPCEVEHVVRRGWWDGTPR